MDPELALDQLDGNKKTGPRRKYRPVDFDLGLFFSSRGAESMALPYGIKERHMYNLVLCAVGNQPMGYGLLPCSFSLYYVRDSESPCSNTVSTLKLKYKIIYFK